jgi:integrin-linked kinase-associated serine/threonine phosphatase 2C
MYAGSLSPTQCDCCRCCVHAQGFTSTDAQLLQQCAQHSWTDGATCVALWLVGSTALVANIGDAKCVLARQPQQVEAGNGAHAQGSLRAVLLTKDHLAMYPEERSRIEKAGGHVTADGRLNGRMQVRGCCRTDPVNT